MLSSILHSFFYFLSSLFLASSQINSSPDHVDPNDPHISDLLVSHYDCFKQHNLRQFSLTRVQPCTQAPSAFESTRAIVDVFVRAKAKRLKAWTCEAYVKREKFVCAQSDYKYRRHDRTDYHQNTMERPRTLDPTECKHAIRHLNGTNNPQLNAFNYSNSFTFFNDIQKQRLLETKQSPFRITKLNTFHYGAFAWISNSQLVLNSTLKEKAVCWDRYEYIIEKDSWSLIVKEIEITYDDKDNKLIYHGHTLPCLHDDGFCKPTILTPFTIVWFPEDLCLIFSIHSFIGRMSKLNNRYWLETEHFFITTPPQFQPILLIMIPNLKPVSLVLKFSLKIKCFVINRLLYILLNILIFLLHIKKDLICKLVNPILFNYRKMNNIINLLPS